MTRATGARCPIQCIIPPYMTEHMIERGDPQTRSRGIELLTESTRIRAQREIRAMMAPIMARSRSAGVKRRNIYDAKNGGLDGRTLVKSEGSAATADTAVEEAYDGLGATYDYFIKLFGRNSIDGQGMQLDATVHVKRNYNNAHWDGEQMVFGDGDGVLFNRFTIARDIIAHELCHGVVEHTSNLEYQGQSGALNESFADVFGILVKLHSLGQPASAPGWFIGEGIFTKAVKGKALRSMQFPGTAYKDDPNLGTDPQPNHMKGYVNTDKDNGGVHYNSGIPNRAFVLAALQIGGDAWREPGLIWYRSLLQLTRHSNFQDMANMSEEVSSRLFGPDSRHRQAITEAWSTVGLPPSSGLSAIESRSLVSGGGSDDFSVFIDRVAQELGTKLVEVVAAELRENRSAEAATTPTRARRKRTAKKPAAKKKSSKK